MLDLLLRVEPVLLLLPEEESGAMRRTFPSCSAPSDFERRTMSSA